MAIHRIKAGDKTPAKNKTKPAQSTPPKKDKKPAKPKTKTPKTKKTFILFRPFTALGHYIRDSWHEIRQVRWPDRKLTWKMTLSVIIYVAIFATVIMLLDALFTFLFNQLLGV